MFLRRNLIQVFTRNYAKPAFRKVRSDALSSILMDKPDVIQWEGVRKQMMENDYTVNTTNVDALIISKCFNGARLDIAKSYLEYLKSNNLNISDAFVIRLIRLYYARYRTKEEDFTKEQAEELLKLCNESDFVRSYVWKLGPPCYLLGRYVDFFE